MLQKFKKNGYEIAKIENEKKLLNSENFKNTEEVEDAEEKAKDINSCKVNNISDISNCMWLREKINIIRRLHMFKKISKRIKRQAKEKKS